MLIDHMPYSRAFADYAILPVGCYEQHGPILPMATDSLIATHLAADLGRALGRGGRSCHLFPAVHFTPTEPNLDFQATVHVDNQVARLYLREVIKGILVSPFQALVVVNAHGSVAPGLKEVAFSVVMEQFRGPQEVRPVLCVDVFEFAGAVRERFGQGPGRHADWTEFLLTYSILGPTYYTSERLEEFYRFAASHDFNVPQPAVLGIPLQHRSVDGVQGEPLPPKSSLTLAEQAEEFRLFITGKMLEKVTQELARFAALVEEVGSKGPTPDRHLPRPER